MKLSSVICRYPLPWQTSGTNIVIECSLIVI